MKTLIYIGLGLFRYPDKQTIYEVIGFDNMYLTCYYRKYTPTSGYQGKVYETSAFREVIPVNY